MIELMCPHCGSDCNERDELIKAEREIERLNAVIKLEQHRAGRIGTHGPGCHLWGPAHYECLVEYTTDIRADVLALCDNYEAQMEIGTAKHSEDDISRIERLRERIG